MFRLIKPVIVVALIVVVFKYLYTSSTPSVIEQYRDLYPSLEHEDVKTVQCVIDRSWSGNPNIEELVKSGKADGLSFDLPRYLEECK